MGRDPLGDRFEQRREKRRLDTLARKARSTDDLEAEEQLLADTEKVQPLTADAKPGRNDPCPCGSGKKYKKCCGLKE